MKNKIISLEAVIKIRNLKIHIHKSHSLFPNTIRIAFWDGVIFLDSFTVEEWDELVDNVNKGVESQK